ncbi:glycosyl hydrolase family 18 protein [Candidatus Parcubacteria bacterium]|nr:glycosyl hydrolase family 18 protein [Candidatus Parcubacteria bacterium]
MKRTSIAAFVLVSLVFPTGAFGATEDYFEVSGWVPYWTGTRGTTDARRHLDELTTVMPFTYSVSSNGTLKDLGGMKKSTWRRLTADAKANDVRVIPSIMWSDSAAIHAVLSDEDRREEHVEEIVTMVKKGKYDGVDIDYENKFAKTSPYFSLFLWELDDALAQDVKGALLSCTIEPRTPPDSLYRVVPQKLEYANDYKRINQHCDRVNIMTYDQQRADIALNDARRGAPYYPVSDIDWVRKVVELAVKDIDKSKIVLGVPTYGREVEVTVAPDWFKSYHQLWSVNPEYAEDTAKEYDVTPTRHASGELMYSYIPGKSGTRFLSAVSIPNNTDSGGEAAARALAHATKTGQTVKVNVVWWSDAGAIKQKIDLAKTQGLRGVAIFKIDGAEDRDIWDLF